MVGFFTSDLYNKLHSKILLLEQNLQDLKQENNKLKQKIKNQKKEFVQKSNDDNEKIEFIYKKVLAGGIEQINTQVAVVKTESVLLSRLKLSSYGSFESNLSLKMKYDYLMEAKEETKENKLKGSEKVIDGMLIMLTDQMKGNLLLTLQEDEITSQEYPAISLSGDDLDIHNEDFLD